MEFLGGLAGFHGGCSFGRGAGGKSEQQDETKNVRCFHNLFEPYHIGGYMIFNFGKSCESTRPTGSCFTLTTIKSSMFRSLKILNASTASASSRMQMGFRVITFLSGCASRLALPAMWRRK